jgi:tape measure domain-containing protein
VSNVTTGYTISMRTDGAREVITAIEKTGAAALDAGRKVDTLQNELDGLTHSTPGIRSIEDALDDVGKGGGGAAAGIGRAVEAAKSLAAAYGAITAARFFVEQADAYNRIQSQLGLITEGEAARAELTSKVLAIAQETGTEFEAQAKLVNRLSTAASELGVTQQQVLDVSKLISQTFVITGATAAEAASSAQQFAQAIASGSLQGDELRSILENNTALARALADGLGVGVGRLKEMGANGELQARNILPAILTQAEKINAQYARAIPLMSQGVERLSNSSKNLVGALDSALGASQLIERALSGAAKAADQIAELIRQNPNSIRNGAIRAVGGALPGGSIPAEALIRGLDLKSAADSADARRQLQDAATQGDIQNFIRGGGFGSPGSLLRDSPLGQGARPNSGGFSSDELAALAGFSPPSGSSSGGGGRGGRGSSAADTEARAFDDLSRAIADAKREAAGFYAATLTPAEQLAKEIERVVALKDYFGDGEFERVMGDFATQAQALQDASDGTADALQRIRDYMAQAAAAGDPLKRTFEDIQMLKASGALSGEQLQETEAAFAEHMARINEQYSGQLSDFQQAALAAGDSISDVLADAIGSGFEDGFDVARQAAAQALREIALQQIKEAGKDLLKDFVLGAIQAYTGVPVASLSKATASGPSGGPKAMGGPVQAGRTYLVGETGPEMFTAPANGRITPSGETAAGKGGGVTVVNVKDPREALLAMQTAEGGSVLRNLVSTNRDEFRRILGVT